MAIVVTANHVNLKYTMKGDHQMNTALQLVEPDKIGEKALTYTEAIAKLPPIKTNEEYVFVGELWKTGKALLEEINEGYDSLIKKAHELHKDAIAKKARYYVPTEAGVKAAKKLLSDYSAEQERIRKAEEERLAAIARAEEEARRKAEQERLEAERKAEEDRLLAEAVAAEARGDKETADALTAAAEESNEQVKELAATLAAEPIYVAPVVVPKTTPKMAGGPVYREVWAAEVVDIKALCMAVATGKASTECVSGNMVALNRMAVALKGTMNIPGVKAYARRV
jgi:uncharacterized membrane protein YqiK